MKKRITVVLLTSIFCILLVGCQANKTYSVTTVQFKPALDQPDSIASLNKNDARILARSFGSNDGSSVDFEVGSFISEPKVIPVSVTQVYEDGKMVRATVYYQQRRE